MKINVKSYYAQEGETQQQVFEKIFRQKVKMLNLKSNGIDGIIDIGDISAVLPMEETA